MSNVRAHILNNSLKFKTNNNKKANQNITVDWYFHQGENACLQNCKVLLTPPEKQHFSHFIPSDRKKKKNPKFEIAHKTAIFSCDKIFFFFAHNSCHPIRAYFIPFIAHSVLHHLLTNQIHEKWQFAVKKMCTFSAADAKYSKNIF